MRLSVFYHDDGFGGVHETDLIECTPEEWDADERSLDPDWSVIRPPEGGALVRALRLPAALRHRPGFQLDPTASVSGSPPSRIFWN